VNNSVDDKGRLLKLNNRETLVYNICAYTMDMIADKSPDGGKKDLLHSLAD
jgi:hypothetical protein